MLCTIAVGFWLMLNQGGGSDLAKGPPALFTLFWWTLTCAAVIRLQQRGVLLPRLLPRGILWMLGITLFVAFGNLVGAMGYASGFSLGVVALVGWVNLGAIVLSGVWCSWALEEDLAGLAPVLLWIHLVLGALIAIYGLMQVSLAGGSEPLSSVFSWHNPAGGYFLLVLPLALARALGERNARLAAIYALLAGLFLAALMLTNSRGSWLTGAAAIAYLVGTMALRRLVVPWRLGAVVGAVVLAIALPFLVGGPLAPIRDRMISFSATRDFSVEGRSNFYGTATRLFAYGPRGEGLAFFGTGLDTYRYLSPLQQLDARFYASDPHSVLFGLLAEAGAPGAMLFLLAWGWWVWVQSREGIEGRELPESGLWPGWRLDVAGLLAALGGGWLHWSLDFDSTFLLITWTAATYVALLVAVLRQRRGAGPLFTFTPSPPEPKEAATRIRIREIHWNTQYGRVLSAVLLLATIVAWCRGINRLCYDAGERAYGQYEATGETQWLTRSEAPYRWAATFWPWDGDALRGLSLAQLWFAIHAAGLQTDEGRKLAAETLARARGNAERAAYNAPYQAVNLYHYAFLLFQELQMGIQPTTPESIDAFRYAAASPLRLDPINNPSYYRLMVLAFSLYNPTPEDWRALAETVERFAIRYPPARVAEFTRTRQDESWQQLPEQYLQIWFVYLQALQALQNEAAMETAIKAAHIDLIPQALEVAEAIAKDDPERAQLLMQLAQQIDDAIVQVLAGESIALPPLQIEGVNPAGAAPEGGGDGTRYGSSD